MIRIIVYPVIAFLVFVIDYNIIYNKDFLITPIYTIFNISVAIFFAYYLTQKKNDERKLKETAENIINKIQNIISDDYLYNINEGTNKRKLLMMHRQIGNKMFLLNSVKNELKLSPEITYIKNTFQDYRNFVGEHINNIDYLSNSEDILMKLIGLIDDKLDEIIVKLYK